MADRAAVRNWEFGALENNVKAVESIIGMSDPAVLNVYRDGGTGWTVLEVLGHLRDFEDIAVQRARLNVEQDNPALPMPNPDALAAEHKYNEQNLDDVLADWKAKRAEYVAYMKGRAEGDWDGTGIHPSRGPMTLEQLLLLAPTHDAIHIEQTTRILREKRTG